MKLNTSYTIFGFEKSVFTILSLLFIFLSINLFSQNIKDPVAPSFNQINTLDNNKNQINSNNNPTIDNNNITAFETNTNFATNYKAPNINQLQNKQTKDILSLYNEVNTKESSFIKKQLWELKLRFFKFSNPNSETYKTYQSLYYAAFDSINQMLSGIKPINLKRAVFLVENVFYMNKLKYADFNRLIENKVYIINQIIKNEKLNKENNVALNYAIQQLYLKPIRYTDAKGIVKTHQTLKYDFNDPYGVVDYKNQLVTKFLFTGTGQCHSMPLLYLILANEIGAKANIAYSPNHSYIAFPDDEDNYYNFECTSGGFTSYSFIMSSGYIKKEAIKSGIYTLPTTLKETIANQLTDLANNQLSKYRAIDDFQLICAKRTLEFFPNDIMALQTVANYQSAKTEAEICYAGWPSVKDIPNIPELKKEFDNRDNIYNYIENLGYAEMTDTEYMQWLNSLNISKLKLESEAIKKAVLIKAKL